MAGLAKFASRLLIVSSLAVLSGCSDRLFDNPFDPEQGEVVFEIMSTIYTPALSPRGMTWDGTVLWNVDGSNGLLDGLNPANGSLVRSLRSPLANTADIAYDGQNIWVCGEADIDVYKLNIINGDVQKRLSLQRGTFIAMEYAQGRLWLVDAQTNKILQVDPETAEVLGSFQNPGVRAGGLAFDGGHFWISDPPTLSIYEVDPAGRVLRKYLAPGPAPQGLAFDGRFLWNVDANQKVFQLRIQP
jgi:streptogramin lyase